MKFFEIASYLSNDSFYNLWKEIGNQKYLELALNIGHVYINYNMIANLLRILEDYDLTTFIIQDNVKNNIYEYIYCLLFAEKDINKSYEEIKKIAENIGLAMLGLILDKKQLRRLKDEIFSVVSRFYPSEKEFLQVYYEYLKSDRDYTKEEAKVIDNEFLTLKTKEEKSKVKTLKKIN